MSLCRTGCLFLCRGAEMGDAEVNRANHEFCCLYPRNHDEAQVLASNDPRPRQLLPYGVDTCAQGQTSNRATTRPLLVISLDFTHSTCFLLDTRASYSQRLVIRTSVRQYCSSEWSPVLYHLNILDKSKTFLACYVLLKK